MTTILDSQVLKQPSERDLEVYRLVVVEGRTTRAAAECVGLSQTRVCQLVERVVQWLAAVLPPAAEGLTKEARVMLAQQISMSRLDHLYGEAMAAWRDSKVGETVACQSRKSESSGMVKLQTARREHGNVRYLAAAMHICLKMAKLPASPFSLAMLSHGPEATPAAIPPVEDCSALADEQPSDAESPEFDACGIALPDGHYEQAIAADQAASERLLSVFDTVQDDDLDGGTRASRNLATISAPPLSRKQRRARQRLLAKRLRKAK